MKVLTQTGLTELIAKTKEADATKVNIAQGSSASSQIMVTDASGNITPSGTTGEYFDTTLPIWDAEQVKYDDGTVTDELERLEEDKADVTAIPAEVISALADLPISTTNALKVDVPDNGVIKTGGTVKPVNDADYQKIQSSATANDFAIFDSNGQVVDSGLDESDFIVADAQALPKIVNSGVVATSTQITELTENKITVLSSSSTDTEYPSAKCVYDELATKQAEITTTNKLSADLVDDTSTTNKFVPTVATADKDKYLHTNASTGALEWTEVQGGTEWFEAIYQNTSTLYAQIDAAVIAGKKLYFSIPTFGEKMAAHYTKTTVDGYGQYNFYTTQNNNSAVYICNENTGWGLGDVEKFGLQYETLPATASNDTIVQYIGSNTSTLKKGYFYRCYNNVWTQVDVAENLQFSSISGWIPVEGMIRQYIGTTNSYFTNGYFYKYTDGAWEQVDVQPSAGVTSVNGQTGAVTGLATSTDLQQGLSTRQSLLSDAQINACNSGITASKVSAYDGYASEIAGKVSLYMHHMTTSRSMDIYVVSTSATVSGLSGGSISATDLKNFLLNSVSASGTLDNAESWTEHYFGDMFDKKILSSGRYFSINEDEETGSVYISTNTIYSASGITDAVTQLQ